MIKPMNPNKNEQNLSELLKERRQSKNFSLEKLSELTKIQLYHLEAMEAGQFEKLPPSVYRDGILKRLSKFLDIDKDEIMKMYKNKFELGASTIPLAPAYPSYSFFILTQSKFMVFAGTLALVLLFGYLWYQFNFLIGPPSLVIKPSEDVITKEESILVNGKTNNGIDLTINGENTYVDSNGSFEKNVKLAAGLNIIEIRAINNFGKVTKIIRQIFRETP